MNKKKWLTLSLVATALLLVPRRSSRQTLPATNLPTTDKKLNSEFDNQENQAADFENKK